MAHFNFENTVSELIKMDGPIQRGPMMRWQKKALSLDSGIRHLSIPESGPLSPWKPKSSGSTGGKTPLKGAPTPVPIGGSKTPNRTPGRSTSSSKGSVKTPSRKTPKTPGNQQDRFIPNRASTDTEMSHFAMMNNENEDPASPTKQEYQQRLSENLTSGQVPQDCKILNFKQKAPAAKEGHMNNLKVLYSSGKCAAPKATSTRQIPQQPERILDAPELLDDYYLNLLDWSSNNHVAIALGNSTYVWNAGSGEIMQLPEMENPDEYISCVNWIKEGNILAVGTSIGTVQLWDVGKEKLIRTMTGHAARVGSLSWNAYILSSGSRSSAIHHHDVRVADHHVGTLANHTQEICGLRWSPDGRFLASGGNDNMLNIWEGMSESPMHTFSDHHAAVKALAWCPWQPSILASGGGTADRHIRMWNVPAGSCLQSVDTNSQVCSVLWSSHHKELISGHGFSQNQLTIWKYPSMNKITDLTGHTARVLCLAMSPDGSTVASAAADETIRMWRCFAVDKHQKSSSAKMSKERMSGSALSRGIR